MKKLILLLAFLVVGCETTPSSINVNPSSPTKVNEVKIEWKVIAEVKEIEGKKYLVIPYDGNPYVGLKYSDSLILRSWLNDVKRYKDQSDTLLCYYGHVDKCKVSK